MRFYFRSPYLSNDSLLTLFAEDVSLNHPPFVCSELGWMKLLKGIDTSAR